MKIYLRTAILIIILLSNTKICSGQTPSYMLSAENFHPNGDYYTANEFTFDIVINHTDSTLFEYAGGQYGLIFNTDLANGGTLSYTFAGPDTSELPQELRPVNPGIVYGKQISKLILEINNFPGPGSGFFIPAGSRIKIAKMKLKTTAATFLMEPGPLGGWYKINFKSEWDTTSTKIFSYIGNSPVEIRPYYRYIYDFGLSVNPVELNSFTSEVDQNKVYLRWITAGEINNFGFDIERKGENDSWIKTGFVAGSGTTTQMKYYSFSENAVTGKYLYRLKQIDYNGNYEYFELANEVQVGAPDRFELSQNFPNPFNPATKIFYSIPKDEYVILKVYNIEGKEVSTLINRDQNAGYYGISFDASDLPGGVYFYSLVTNGSTKVKRMILIK